MKYAHDALHKAAYDGDIDTVEKILQTKPDADARDSFGGTALHAAMFQQNMKIVTMLIDYGLDVNAIGPQNGYTPMHDAVWGENLKAIEILLAHGAKADIHGKDGLTPYQKAKKEGKTAIVNYFESHGINK